MEDFLALADIDDRRQVDLFLQDFCRHILAGIGGLRTDNNVGGFAAIPGDAQGVIDQ